MNQIWESSLLLVQQPYTTSSYLLNEESVEWMA